MTARDRLVDATRDLLWERGYAATSPKAILDRADAGQGSMYHHFGGKEDLARAALDRSAAELRSRAQDALTAPGSHLDRLVGYLALQRNALRGCPVGRMTGDHEVLDRPLLHSVLDTTFAELRAAVTEVTEAAARDGELAAGIDPRDLADTVLAVVQGGYVLARAAGESAPFDRAVRGATALLENARTTDANEETS